MKIICIKHHKGLTLGKTYDTLSIDAPLEFQKNWFTDNNYKITNDDLDTTWIVKENFITIEEYREQQLNKVL